MQLEFFDIPSPCIGVCQSNDKGQCLGCFRTRDERVGWINYTSDDKQKVIKRCVQRKNRKAGQLKAKEATIDNRVNQPSLLDKPEPINVDNSIDIDFGDFEL